MLVLVLTVIVRDTAVGVACVRWEGRREGGVAKVDDASGAGACTELVKNCRDCDQAGHTGQV